MGEPKAFVLFSPLGASLKNTAHANRLKGRQAKLAGSWATFLTLWKIPSGDAKAPPVQTKSSNGKMWSSSFVAESTSWTNPQQFLGVNVSIGSVSGASQVFTLPLVSSPHVCGAGFQPLSHESKQQSRPVAGRDLDSCF